MADGRQRLREKLDQERMLSDRLFRGFENAPLFPGWRALRNDYLRARGLAAVGPTERTEGAGS